MNCPPKKMAAVERWPLLEGGHLWRFDGIAKIAESMIEPTYQRFIYVIIRAGKKEQTFINFVRHTLLKQTKKQTD